MITDQIKWSELIANFKKQCEVSWGKSRDTMKELLNSGLGLTHEHYDHFKDLVGEEREAFRRKMTQVDNDLLEKLHKAQQSIKDTMAEDYNKLLKSTANQKAEMQKNLDEFKLKMKDAFDIVSDKTSQNYQDAINALNNYKGKTTDELKKFYNDMIARLDKIYNEAIGKLTTVSSPPTSTSPPK